ncbi:MAG TPA: VWA domain-containing protein [Vicinamibacterales bacterium]|nr:VWA domain-containing protein [Vicinamibacterales bacterium]
MACATAVAQSQTQTARLYLEALDERGPVELMPSDVEIFDSGAKRTITQLIRADDPMRIVMLVDNSRSAQPFIQEIRAGIVAFADAIPTAHELALVTIGNTPVVRQEPSLDRTKLTQIAKTLTTGGTTVLVGAMYEMYDRFLRNAGDRWPVLVIVTTDGTEGSGQFYPQKFAAFGRDMQAKDVAAHAIVLISAKGDALQVPIAKALTGGTGGTYNTTATGGNLTARLAALAQDIVADYDRTSSQYLLEFASETGQPAADLKVSLLRDGVKMRMSRAGRIRD